MTAKPSRAQLAQLDQSALIDLILQLLDQIEQLEARLPPPKPPTTSANSSLPPSREQKSQRRAARAKAKHGPKAGHPGSTREWCPAPDQVTVQRVTVCQGCGADLAETCQVVERRHQLLELPPISAQVIE